MTTRILDTTERLIVSGERFADMPVALLLIEANVSRSSFYANFGDKSALLLALAEKTLAEVVASGARWWQSTHALGPSAAAETVRDLIGIYRSHGPVIRTIAEAAAYDQAVRDLWRSQREGFAAQVAKGIRAEQKDGLVAADLDVPRTACYLTHLVDVAVLDHVEHGNPRDDRKVAAALARMGWLAYYGELPSGE